jgi:hypothetical protein
MMTAEHWAEVIRVTLRHRAARKGVEPLTVEITPVDDVVAMLDLVENKILEAERAAGWDDLPDLPREERGGCSVAVIPFKRPSNNSGSSGSSGSGPCFPREMLEPDTGPDRSSGSGVNCGGLKRRWPVKGEREGILRWLDFWLIARRSER